MTAVTVNTDQVIAIPGMEVQMITANDGYTYKSKKFKTLTGGIFQQNATAAAADAATVTVATNTATISLAGTTTNVTGTLILFGE